MALLWLVLSITHSIFAVGVVVTATLLPVVVVGPLLGVYADRWPRRRILLITNLVEGVLVASLSALALVHATDLGLLIAIVLGLSTGAQFVRVTSNALVPQTVGVAQLGAANGLLSFSNSFNQIIGLSIGGVVVALFGVTLPIEYDALTFFVAAALISRLPSEYPAPPPESGGARPSFLVDLREGFRYIREQRFLVQVILLGIVVNFFGEAISALFAPYAALVLHGGATTFGLLGAVIAAGSLAGGLAIGKVETRTGPGRYLLVGMAALGVTFIALSFARQIPVALGVAAAIGVLISVTNVPLLTLIQAKVPARLMGRVVAVLTSMIVVAAPLGSLFAGTLASSTSIGTVFALSGGVAIAVAVIGLLAFSELRDIRY